MPSGCVTDSTNEKFDPKNIGLAVGILFLASLEAEIHLGVVLPPLLQHKRRLHNLQHMRVNNNNIAFDIAILKVNLNVN